MKEFIKRFLGISDTSKGCAGCTILTEQLREARLREQRKDRQIETLLDQTSTVVQAKFETVHVSPDVKPPKQEPLFDPETITDVQSYDDEQFIAAAERAYKN